MSRKARVVLAVLGSLMAGGTAGAQPIGPVILEPGAARYDYRVEGRTTQTDDVEITPLSNGVDVLICNRSGFAGQFLIRGHNPPREVKPFSCEMLYGVVENITALHGGWAFSALVRPHAPN